MKKSKNVCRPTAAKRNQRPSQATGTQETMNSIKNLANYYEYEKKKNVCRR